MIYEIAGLKVEMEPKFERLTRQSKAYISSGEPVMKVKPAQKDEEKLALSNYTDEEKEYICFSAAFCRSIIRYGRFFLHASAVVYEGKAYLFSAPSGTGKSTHTSLWRKRFQKSYILNDDKPVIMPQKEQITVWGTPFSGKSDLQVNCGVPLGGICFLKQGKENCIFPVTEDRALALLLNNTYRPGNSEEMNLLLDMLEQVVARINIFEMSCTEDIQAAEISYKALKGK